MTDHSSKKPHKEVAPGIIRFCTSFWGSPAVNTSAVGIWPGLEQGLSFGCPVTPKTTSTGRLSRRVMLPEVLSGIGLMTLKLAVSECRAWDHQEKAHGLHNHSK